VRGMGNFFPSVQVVGRCGMLTVVKDGGLIQESPVPGCDCVNCQMAAQGVSVFHPIRVVVSFEEKGDAPFWWALELARIIGEADGG
jgi:hypothetical protein